MYFIYFLYSEKSDIYYTGYTSDYQTRLLQHNNSNLDSFSKKNRPWKLAAVFECGEDKSAALKIERFLKKQKSRKLIEKIIQGKELSGVLAQLVRVPHMRD